MNHLTFSNPSLHATASRPLISVILLGQSTTWATAAPGASWGHPPSWGQALLQVTAAPSPGGQPTLFFVLSPLSPFSYSHKSCSRLSALLLHFFFPSHFLNNLSLSLCVNSQITRKHLCKFEPPISKVTFFAKTLIHLPLSCCLACCILVLHTLPGTSEVGEGWATQRPSHLPKVI